MPDDRVRRSPPSAVEIYDTTLRDGSQREGLSFAVEDKLRIAAQLDRLGVTFIEGGWPGANPKDSEFFARARDELRLTTATLVAFGSTRRVGVAAEEDPVLRALLDAGAPVVCIVAKAWSYHVAEALRTTREEALAMVSESVALLRQHGKRVLVDAEHFFDGYTDDAAFALDVVEAAAGAGAEAVVLCDTNGGTLPHDVERIVMDVVARVPGARVGVHFHDDGGCAVANALAAVRAGAVHVQGCVNGFGERTGNANLMTIIPNLTLKMGIRTIPSERLGLLTEVAHHVAELANLPVDPQQPYVGRSAFAHKAGLHTSALARRRDAYEHIDPAAIGNATRVVVSELAGRSTVQMKAAELGIELDDEAVATVLDDLKRLENEGYHFEVADGSLDLLLRRATGWQQPYFALESYRVITEDDRAMSEATIKLQIDDDRVVETAEGNGPVHALDCALRKALVRRYPQLAQVHLADYKVRVIDTSRATGAVTRVLIDTTDGNATWTTIGVSPNIIDASWRALSDSIVFALNRVHQ